MVTSQKGVKEAKDSRILLSLHFLEVQGNLDSLLSKFQWNFDWNSSYHDEQWYHTNIGKKQLHLCSKKIKIFLTSSCLGRAITGAIISIFHVMNV
jgi:hypothetical protein